MATTTLSRNTRRYAPSTHEPIHYPNLNNKPGTLITIPKTELQVDKRYQRRVNARAVHRISQNWNWIACGALICSIRPDDSSAYFIVDGQHRWEGAKLRDDVKDLPCLVFEINDIKDEAAGFLAANTERQIPMMLHRFNALVTINDRTALIANELIKESGRVLRSQTSPGTVSCIGEIMRAIRVDEETTRKIWPLVLELSEGAGLPGTLIKGLVSLERNLAGTSLTEPRVRHKLKSIGIEGLKASMRAVAAIAGNQNERTCAEGILRAINVGVRNPLRMKR